MLQSTKRIIKLLIHQWCCATTLQTWNEPFSNDTRFHSITTATTPWRLPATVAVTQSTISWAELQVELSGHGSRNGQLAGALLQSPRQLAVT